MFAKFGAVAVDDIRYEEGCIKGFNAEHSLVLFAKGCTGLWNAPFDWKLCFRDYAGDVYLRGCV